MSNLSGITAISAGDDHNLALKSNGEVWAWGNNKDGQLGTGTREEQKIPVKVANLSGVALIATGTEYSLAIRRTP